ncbi:MAG: hypothetical protein ACI91R_002302, partial [Vicingaceae bacterium]
STRRAFATNKSPLNLDSNSCPLYIKGTNNLVE